MISSLLDNSNKKTSYQKLLGSTLFLTIQVFFLKFIIIIFSVNCTVFNLSNVCLIYFTHKQLPFISKTHIESFSAALL